MKSLILLLIVVGTFTPSIAFASPTNFNAGTVLDQLRFHHQDDIKHAIVRGNHAYILTTSMEGQKKMLHLWNALLNNDGRWVLLGGSAIPISDKPWKLFRRNRSNLAYSMTRFASQRGEDVIIQFDWCLIGYTTDHTVTSFRIKTQDGFVPLEAIQKQYFMKVLTEREQKEFIEVQGLNANGEIVQRDNGQAEDKPRQWSPHHSDF